MFTHKLLAAVLAAAVLLSACGAAPQNLSPSRISPTDASRSEAPADSAELTVTQKLEDLSFLCDQLEKNHKNLFARTTKEQFYEAKQGIADKIPTLSNSNFFLELKKLVASIGDAHTSIAFKDSIYKHFRALPFAVIKIEGRWHLGMAEQANEPYLGWIVTAINDTAIEEVYTRASSIVSHENTAWVDGQFSNTINFADTLYYLGVIPDITSATLHLKHPTTGETQSVTMPSMSEQEILSAKIIAMQTKDTPNTSPSGIYRSQPIGDSVYFIQYNSCEEAPDLSMKDFIKAVEADLTAKSYPKVIVDLRYNSGGNSAIFEPMIKKLGTLQKQQSFKLYTLVGENTFSSAILNAIQLQQRTDTVTVGSPTGGNVNHYGEVKTFDLPGKLVSVRYSTKYFEMVKGYTKDSLYPDIAVTPAYEQVLAGTDCEVETVLAL